jgi:hypothetical protein
MTHKSDNPDGTSQAASRKRPALLQWNLLSLFLLIAAVAVWAGYLRCLQRTSDLSRQVDIMLQVAADPGSDGAPKEILVRTVQDYWNDRLAWDLCLPDGKYSLRAATHGIEDRGIAPADFESPVQGGRHRIELQTSDNGKGYSVLVDGRHVIDILRKPIPSPFSPFDDTLFDGTEDLDKPLILFRCAFRWPNQTEMETNGLLLWIERAD